jgi:putative protease
MELVAPAGSIGKLRYAYRYGADAAYIGLAPFSLRSQAEDLDGNDSELPDELRRIKESYGTLKPKRLYCALNVQFHDDDLTALKLALPTIAHYHFDALIVSDLGAYAILRDHFPEGEFHLSTQANCTNPRAAKFFHSVGFKRIVPGRELSIDEIKAIKDGAPELEIEAFVHGAMCMSYSGRCFLSSWMTGRAANKGDCAHSCRWRYKVYIEEEERAGQLIPVESGESTHGGHTLLMSSRDLCMIDHLVELRSAGVDAIKIEGRMKSEYYVALVTQAYRWGLDHPDGANPFAAELDSVSHREYDTGFYFGRSGMDTSTTKSYRQTHLFLGSFEKTPSLMDSLGTKVDASTVCKGFSGEEWSSPRFVEVKNSFQTGSSVQLIGPGTAPITLETGDYRFFDTDGILAEKVRHGKAWFFQAKIEKLRTLEPGLEWLLRKSADNAEHTQGL